MKRMIKTSGMSDAQRVKMSNDLVQKIYDIIEPHSNLAGADVWADSDGPVFYVRIENGDWKHEHLLLKHLLDQAGFLNINTVEEGESDSDCYTATHYFIPSSPMYAEYRD